MADVNLTVDGKKFTAPAGTLLIEACKSVGIEVPSFCYYPNLSLQGACRMCLVKIEKMPKLQTACTTVVSEGMVVSTDSDEVKQARKSMLEMLLGNHPLDCPVCDAGGECELQDMTFTYGAAESKFMEAKNHKDEQQWSPVVFFDRPRCILCYRCVRVCGEGMDVWALGVQNRGVSSLIAPNKEDHLECEECGMCIDICPVGALTSGAYRYKTRPWEMKHVGTVCTHCGDGCKTTLGVRRSETGMEIVRGDNRDKSGINGDFLCIKGRYAFDFANHEERLTQPLIRKNGKLTPSTWEEAFELVGKKFAEVRDQEGGEAIGVIGSTRTTNEEAYLLSKFARLVLKTNNVDHHRTADFPALAAVLCGKSEATATMADPYNAPAILLIGNDPTQQHPLLAWQIRNNVRLHRARFYVINSQPIKLRRQATSFMQIPAGTESKVASFLAGDDSTLDVLTARVDASDSPGQDGRERPSPHNQWIALRDKLRSEQNLLIIFGSEIRGGGVASLVSFGSAIAGAKFICLADYANSRGAADMGLYPDLLPGYHPTGASSEIQKEWTNPSAPGLDISGMTEAARSGKLKALHVVGSNPIGRLNIDPFAFSKSFVVVQDMFLTETAVVADVVLPAANLYEKSGTVTNTCGDVQLVKKAGEVSGTKTDFEMIVRIADAMGFEVRRLVPFRGGTHADMGQSRGVQSGEADRHAVWLEMQGLEPKLSPFDPTAILDEIQRLVPGYHVSRMNLLAGNSEHTTLANSGPGAAHKPETIILANETLFSSGTLGRYSRTLQSVIESHEVKPAEVAAD
ncbi:NADH-quinone oxidoreductase, chain G [Candidatus Sulfotelmatobacter kueseliae]|uniref:NADH-quinone oxidoreductase, chain G n=1 Tax=Candidatus Sulfotelmatobacter kueseliae TaxID=2042962 RepID=A0A2U3LCV0_9BACT|nr:NADH-quinone oxidoreductase, chain G [Candidatus Sulfotelmatobacter kueseliae]